MICGLLGEKLGHSYSPQIHGMLADYSYNLYQKSADELKQFLLSGDFHGLNVTIPYKKAVIPYCDELSAQARQLGAVNTIVKAPDGRLIGHNTDYFGFQSMLDRTKLKVKGKKVLVLGSGGASNTVCAVMKERGARVVVISRTGEDNYSNLDRHYDCSVIVNATPVGTYPNTTVAPLDITPFEHLEGVLDLIYNPARTKLLQQAEANGLVAENGLWMLVAQAKESAEWFTGKKIKDEMIGKVYSLLRRQMENIVLIGMPGSGKSTIGKLLAEQLHRTFVDSDACIVEAAGRPIPEIFAEDGEEGFRALEAKVLANLGKQSGLVIATGGGCVTRSENYASLHQNGTILWLKRNLEELPTSGRPLSQAGSLQKMYEARKPLYEAFSDLTVASCRVVQDTVNSALCALCMEDMV